MSTARAPPNSTVTSRWTCHETLSGPKYPRSAITPSLVAGGSRTGDTRDAPKLPRNGFGGQDHEMVPRSRPADVQILAKVLEMLVAELGQDHDRPFEPLERVYARRQDRIGFDGLGQPEAIDRPLPP